MAAQGSGGVAYPPMDLTLKESLCWMCCNTRIHVRSMWLAWPRETVSGVVGAEAASRGCTRILVLAA